MITFILVHHDLKLSIQIEINALKAAVLKVLSLSETRARRLILCNEALS